MGFLTKVFSDFDVEQEGRLQFTSFYEMSQELGLSLTKKELKTIFMAIDKHQNGFIRLDELKNMLVNGVQKDLIEHNDNQDTENELMDSTNDEIYDRIKLRMEKKKLSFERIISIMKLPLNQFMNDKGLQKVIEKAGIILQASERDAILKDMRNFHGKRECSNQDFLEFMTRKKIEVPVDRGLIDPIVSQFCLAFNRVLKKYDITLENCYDMLDKAKVESIPKIDFLKGI
jgi:hypothetical protein